MLKMTSWLEPSEAERGIFTKEIEKDPNSKGGMLAAANLEQMEHYLKMDKLGLPFLENYSDWRSYYNLERCMENITSKAFMKYLRKVEKMDSFKQLRAKAISGNFASLIRVLGNSTHLAIDVFTKYTDDFHELHENLPVINKGIDKDEFLKFINRISKYEKSSFFTVLKYCNYKRIRTGVFNKNKAEIMLMTEKISDVDRLRALQNDSTAGKTKAKYISFNKKRANHTYFNSYSIKGLTCIKNRAEADFWGKETLCCLKKGGASEALLDVIESSPLAVELVGTVNDKKVAIFAWDMLQIDKENAYKTLILDNIESNKKLTEKETQWLLDEISNQYGYKRIFLGTQRNDCKVPEFIELKSRVKRQFIPSGYLELYSNSAWAGADSATMYSVKEKEDDIDFKLRKMDITDLHTIKYLEDYLYDGIDEDLLWNVDLTTPCYVVDSSTHTLGYFLTRYKYFKKGKGRKQDDEVKTKKGRNSEDVEKVFYIEDLVLTNYRGVKLSLKHIVEDLISWLKKNKIKEVLVNPNKDSKGLLKRLEKANIKVIFEEEMEELKPTKELPFDKELKVKVRNSL